jgi:hypothetical protein
MASVHTGSNLAIQMILGGIVGLFFGLVFGGAEGKWLDCIYPSASEEEDDIPRVRASLPRRIFRAPKR